IEGETASSSQAVAVTQWDSGNITGVELIEAHLTVGSDQRNNISNTDLGDYDSSVSGKMTFHDVNAGALTVDVDAKVNGEEIYVKGGNTYQPDSSGGDTVNTHDIEINGTFDLDSNVVAASGSWDNNGLFIANTGSVSFTGIGAETVSNVASGSFASHFNHFKIDSPGGTGTLTLNDTDVTASGQVKIETGDTLSIASGRKLTQTGSTLVLNGTISGAGRFVYRSATAFPTAGTVSSILVFDAQDGDQTMSNRTYGGQVEVTNNSTTTARNVTMSASTHTLSSNLYVIASTSQNITLVGATNDPTVNITGDLDYTGTAAGSETITSGAGTWTVSGNVNFTDGTFTTEAGNTLIMDGSSKTLTSNAQTLQNLTLSGTITLANAIHTAAGDFSMAGGTITAGTSTVTMTGTANTLTGGGNTLNSLTIDPSSAGTITMQTSNLTVSGTLTITASDKFKIESGRTLTLSGTGTPLSVSGTFEPDDGSTVQYTGSTATVTGTTFGALTLGGTGTYTLPSSSPTIKGNLVVTSGATVASGSATLLFRAGASQSVTDNNGTKQNLGEIAVRASTSGDTTLTLGSAIKIASATIDASQILNADGANTITISSISSPFTVNGTFQPRTGTVQYTGISANIAATKYNNLTLGGAGTYTLPSSGTTTLLGDLVVTSGATVASGSSTLFFREGGSQSVTDNNSTKQNLGEIAVQASTSGNTTLTLASDVRVASVTLDASQTLNANGSNTLTITNADSGGGRPLTASGSFGTFTPSTGTVVFTGNGATSIPVLDYNDLKIQPSANSVTHTFLAGTASVSKTFTVGNGINTGATVTAAANSTGLDVASVSISANTTLTAHASNEFAVGGHWVNNGSFTHSSGTVTFENPRTSSISGVTTFNNLTSTTAGKKIKFGAGQIFTFAGTLTVTGASGNTIKIESTASASQWLANFNNAQSGVTYATIIDSGCNGGTANLTLDGTSVNGGNNGSCWVFPGAAVVENPYTKTQGLGGGASVGGTSGGGIQQTGGTGQGTGGGASEGGGSGGGTPVPPPPGGGGQGTGGGASPVMFDTSWLLGLITWVTQPSSIKF
ncbi:MAG: hypothetical protein Q8R55_05945, partial [Candidatus Taylorbacteria bacterium]|nr:hypothetical protein [Candidatus Taylorbacteria bacterium]